MDGQIFDADKPTYRGTTNPRPSKRPKIGIPDSDLQSTGPDGPKTWGIPQKYPVTKVFGIPIYPTRAKEGKLRPTKPPQKSGDVITPYIPPKPIINPPMLPIKPILKPNKDPWDHHNPKPSGSVFERKTYAEQARIHDAQKEYDRRVRLLMEGSGQYMQPIQALAIGMGQKKINDIMRRLYPDIDPYWYTPPEKEEL